MLSNHSCISKNVSEFPLVRVTVPTVIELISGHQLREAVCLMFGENSSLCTDFTSEIFIDQVGHIDWWTNCSDVTCTLYKNPSLQESQEEWSQSKYLQVLLQRLS